MDITEHPPSAQRDPAEFVGLSHPLPPITPWGELKTAQLQPPEEIVSGLLHRGCKLIIGGTSKSNKSWCLLALAACVATGKPFWGKPVTQGKVLFINFELKEWAIRHRVSEISINMGLGFDTADLDENLHCWNLRGHNSDLTILRPKIIDQIEGEGYALIILDPAYKVLGNRDENANGEIADLMNEFESLAIKANSAIALAHHFAKGDSTAKSAIDRMSGAGAWARDPDSIVVLTPHEEDNCFTVSCILRNHAPIDEFVVRWQYPLMAEAPELNPAALRTPQSKNKSCTDDEFLNAVLPDKTPTARVDIVDAAKAKLGVSQATVYRRIEALEKAKKLRTAGKMITRL